ncbi:hypothetical protein SAMN04487943_106154 [Gracilibacillus orientalis]|uniref:Peptidyl-prolyl cis-trans isomerase n=1 Tax=Gracilibacillus orientalis TaxID=334253 RepID=A0A1I4MC93_9BACI|nr:hypothetical protein [Gracilibacillus orientalis]SFM00673.1 hypothetical protein SAMN04487943_106154 [Gracilibacillus orientalis]
MIIQIKGNVKYQITLDPSVWIFDDRKVKLEEAFKAATVPNEDVVESNIKLHKPPVNHSIKKYNKKELLEHSYLMPIQEFIENAEVDENAEVAILKTADAEHTISIDQLYASYLLFSIDGKIIKEHGPAYFYHGDGSNQDEPIMGIKVIELK